MRCKFMAAMASRSNFRYRGSCAMPASSRSSRVQRKSRLRSSPGDCWTARVDRWRATTVLGLLREPFTPRRQLNRALRRLIVGNLVTDNALKAQCGTIEVLSPEVSHAEAENPAGGLDCRLRRQK